MSNERSQTNEVAQHNSCSTPPGGETNTGLGKPAGRHLRPAVRCYRDPEDMRLYVTYHKIETGDRHPNHAEVTAAVARFIESECRASRPANPNL